MQCRRDFVHRLLELQGQLLATELLHQGVLFFDHDQLAVVDHADAVRHLFGFFDVVRRQNDGDAVVAQPPHQLPHIPAQFHIHARGRFIEKKNPWFVRQGLCDHDPPFHTAREHHDAAVALVPKRQVAQDFLEIGIVGCASEQPAAELHCAHHGFEHADVQFLRHQSDLAARRTVLRDDIVTRGQNLSGTQRDDSTDNADQGGFAGAVGSQQREDFALVDVEVDTVECL